MRKGFAKASFAMLMGAFFLPSMTHATTGYRLAIVDAVQSDSSTYVGYENTLYVLQAGAWIGSPNCPSEWAYFNAKENPHFVAMVLAARTAEKPLRVYVDDSKPKIGVNCQIINLQF